MSRSFLEADVKRLVNKLTLDEKISLLSAPDWWNTSSVKRLNIPSIRMSDGPNVRLHHDYLSLFPSFLPIQGVRGSSHFIPTPAQCLPVLRPHLSFKIDFAYAGSTSVGRLWVRHSTRSSCAKSVNSYRPKQR